jgi:hypothetical protein
VWIVRRIGDLIKYFPFIRRVLHEILIMLGIIIQHNHRSMRVIGLIEPLRQHRGDCVDVMQLN